MSANYDLNMSVDYDLNSLQSFNCKLISDRIEKAAFSCLINFLKCQNADIVKYAY